MRMLAENDVTLLTDSKVVAIEPNGVVIDKKDGSRETVEADTVITAFGQKADTTLSNAIKAKYNIKTTVVGDAEKVAKVGEAIRTGFYAAMAVE